MFCHAKRYAAEEIFSLQLCGLRHRSFSKIIISKKPPEIFYLLPLWPPYKKGRAVKKADDQNTALQRAIKNSLCPFKTRDKSCCFCDTTLIRSRIKRERTLRRTNMRPSHHGRPPSPLLSRAAVRFALVSPFAGTFISAIALSAALCTQPLPGTTLTHRFARRKRPCFIAVLNCSYHSTAFRVCQPPIFIF